MPSPPGWRPGGGIAIGEDVGNPGAALKRLSGNRILFRCLPRPTGGGEGGCSDRLPSPPSTVRRKPGNPRALRDPRPKRSRRVLPDDRWDSGAKGGSRNHASGRDARDPRSVHTMARKAFTAAGSKRMPVCERICSRAFSTGQGPRYGRSDCSASQTSTTANNRAARGMRSSFSPRG